MQPEKKKLYAALALAALSALLAWAYLYQRERQLLGSAQEVKVLVAKRYIPATTRLEGNALAWAHIPAAFVPKGAITDASTVLGMQTLVPFNASEVICDYKAIDRPEGYADGQNMEVLMAVAQQDLSRRRVFRERPAHPDQQR